MSLVETAVRYRAMGLHPIVERPNEKSPVRPGWQGLFNVPEAELRAQFTAAPPGAGIGTVTHGFVVVDLDVGEGKNGLEAVKALPPLPRTLTSVTRSGGRHLFFRLPDGVEVRNSVSKLAPGVDIRGTGGQVVLPPTVIDGAAYRWDEDAPNYMANLPQAWLDLLAASDRPAPAPAPAQAPAPTLTRVRRAADVQFEADRRARYMATLNEPSVEGQNGSAVLMRAAFHAKEMSRDIVEEALPALRDWNTRLATPPWSDADLRRALNNSEAVLGAALDRERPAGPNGQGEAADPQADGVAWVESMQCYVARDRSTGVWKLNQPLTESGALRALVARGLTAGAARTLLKDCQVTLADYVDCDPTQPATFVRDGQTVLNNFVPSPFKPVAGGFPTIAEVLRYLTAGDEAAHTWFENWLAFAYQNPARPMRTVPVCYGAQRTGKSLIARVMTTLMGEQNCATIRNEDVKGRFTSHFVTKLFVTVGEIEAGEVAHATSTLKYLTGEPQLMFEAKGSSAFAVPNRIKMLATSNQTLPVTVEGEGDTRWVLLKQMASPPADYAARMVALFDRATNDWSPAGRAELEAFAHHLATYPVNVDLAFSVHVNDARASAVEASRSSVEQFVESVRGSSLDAVWLANVPDHERTGPSFAHMDFAGHPQLAGAAAVYATYRAFCRACGLQPLGTGRFPGELERYAADWSRTKCLASICETRPFVYRGVPRDQKLRLQWIPLECRQKQLSLSDVKREGSAVMKQAVANVQAAFQLGEEAES